MPVTVGGNAITQSQADQLRTALSVDIGPINYAALFSQLRLEFLRVAASKAKAEIDYAERRWDAKVWRAGEVIEPGMVRLPLLFQSGTATASMKIHRAVTGGVTGLSEPAWATADFHVTPASSSTTDGGVTWRAYNITFFDSVAGNDSTGDGSQATPFQTLAQATIYGNTTPFARLRSGRAIALKRGSVFNSGLQPGSTTARLLIFKDTSDTALNPERVNIMAYGSGAMPRIDFTGLRFGIQVAGSTTAKHHGFATISGVDIGGDAAQVSSGGAGIFVGINPNTDYASVPTSVKIIGCRVRGITNSLGGAATADINGVQSFGGDFGMFDTIVDSVWDDGVWLLGADTKVYGNRISQCGTSFSAFSTRQRGDCLQINSSLVNSGDVAANNVAVVGNVIDHSSHPEKHALVVNPELSGTNRRAKNYRIQWNDIRAYSGPLGSTAIAGYFSGFDGDVTENLFDFGHQTTNDRGIYWFSGGRFKNNFLISRGVMSAIQIGTNTVGAAINSADNSEVAYNTVLSLSGIGTALVTTVGSGVVYEHSNVLIGFANGIDARAGTTHRNNVFIDVATPITAASSASTSGGGNVATTRDQLDGLRPAGSLIRAAGVMSAGEYPAADVAGSTRGAWPVSPGALEAA